MALFLSLCVSSINDASSFDALSCRARPASPAFQATTRRRGLQLLEKGVDGGEVFNYWVCLKVEFHIR
ncbi:hypothetical protein PS2_042606 [Malus domestica]